MRLLLDQNISFRVAKKLERVFPACKHVSDCGLMDKEDPEIWTYAQNKIIWLRTGNLTKNDIVKLLIEKEQQIKEFIEADGFRDVSCFEIE